MYRFNGYLKGAKITNFTSASGVIKSAGEPRGRANGGFIGVDRSLSDNLDNNVDKTSGIWHMSMGITLVEDHPITTIVDNSYYEPQPSEQRFEQTSRTYLGGGFVWNPISTAERERCGVVTWPSGPYGGISSSGYESLNRDWTKVGMSGPDNCDGWIFDVYGIQGYYYTYYPPPVYVEQLDEVTNYYTVWDYF
jgi:hypothetical protein